MGDKIIFLSLRSDFGRYKKDETVRIFSGLHNFSGVFLCNNTIRR